MLAGAAAVLFACSAPEEEGTEAAAPQPAAVEPALVETVTVGTTSFHEDIELTGETEPIRTAVLSAQVPGRIVELDVTEGAAIEEGARVLRVDTANASAQRAQIETQVAALQRDLRRAQSLQERGLGTINGVREIETQLEILDDQLGAVDVSIYQGRMRAPISGIVTEKLAEVGEYANPGQPLANIVDISTIVVRVGLPEREIPFVHEGMDVPVTILATNEQLTGRLARIGVQAHPASRTFPLEIELDNASGALRAGMRAVARIPKRDLTDVVVIPRDAVLHGVEGAEVLVAEGDTAAVRAVTMGPGRGRFVVVEGLAPGATLIVRGHRMLVPGEPIRTVDLGACCGEQLRRFLEGAPAELESDAGPLGG